MKSFHHFVTIVFFLTRFLNLDILILTVIYIFAIKFHIIFILYLKYHMSLRNQKNLYFFCILFCKVHFQTNQVVHIVRNVLIFLLIFLFLVALIYINLFCLDFIYPMFNFERFIVIKVGEYFANLVQNHVTDFMYFNLKNFRNYFIFDFLR